jgi:hypothetical protein
VDLRCGGRRAGSRRPCRAFLGRVLNDAGRWWVEVPEAGRRPLYEGGPLFTPGRRRLDPGAELAAWCPRHSRQVVLDPARLSAAAAAGSRELLLDPLPRRLSVRPVLPEPEPEPPPFDENLWARVEPDEIAEDER